MTRLVTHRWNLDEGQDPPCAGDIVLGRSRRHSWRVVEVRPVESRVHPNAFRATMEPLGEWDPAVEHARRRSVGDGEPARFRYTPR